MEVELPQKMAIKAYAINQKFHVMVPNKNLIQALWPNLGPTMKHGLLQNAYGGETHLIIGPAIYWAVIDNSSGLENLINHKTNKPGILRNKFSWIVSGNLANDPGALDFAIYPIKTI